jgi:hypothetical protein
MATWRKRAKQTTTYRGPGMAQWSQDGASPQVDGVRLEAC